MNRLRRSNEWIRAQVLTLGSTAAGVVVGESPYQTRAQLYDVMRDVANGIIPDAYVNDDMKRGLLTEPLHRQLLEDELGVTVHPHDQDQFIYNPAYPWAHALPDGWILATGEEIPVQLKCPRPRAWHEIKLRGIHGHWLLGSMHSLAVTGAPYEHFSVLNVETMRLIHFPVYPDAKIIDDLMAIEDQFYAAFEAGIRPLEPIEKIAMPNINGQMVEFVTDEALDLSRQWIEADELLADAEALKQQVEAKIKSWMGEARVIQLPGTRFYSIGSPGKKSIDKKAMQRDGIDPTKYEKTGNPYTTFRGYRIGE